VTAPRRREVARALLQVAVGALLLFCLSRAAGQLGRVAGAELAARLGAGLALNAALAAIALAARALTVGGAAAGSALGATVWAFGGWRCFVLLAAFVALGTLATRLGHGVKARAGIAEARGGRRGAASALSKLSVPAAAAVFAATTGTPVPFTLAFAGALATSLADTVATEVGKAFGGRTLLITSLREVPRGTPGAVSAAGTLAGVAAGAGLAALGLGLGLLPLRGALAVAAAALLASTLESVAGATLGRSGVLDHEEVNFLDSLAGAVAAAGLGAWALRA